MLIVKIILDDGKEIIINLENDPEFIKQKQEFEELNHFSITTKIQQCLHNLLSICTIHLFVTHCS